ncbi:YceD family protein [Noviherbaspirillum aerium]|uniref:YceD family protein n=1 Tax=Noviherbaspirillum aerium TaxID=2588497 RepID=UPI00298F8AD1|nr:DUF177 domain-containing protein [Noviherbaspirillum aerium]
MIDAFEFCRLKDQRDGEFSVEALPRLAEESVDRSGAVKWSLRGGTNLHGHPQMILSVSGRVRLLCQRCLTPIDFAIESGAVLVLAPDEGSADEMDALLSDEDVEVIVGSHAFDLRQLVEDEALLTIPLSPRHEACEKQLMPDNVAEVEKESPFAVLKNLKK